MRLLMVADASSQSEAALRLGAQIARGVDEPLTVMAVVEAQAAKSAADAVLTRAREILAPVASDVRTMVRIGQPAEEILREVQEGEYDLVIMGEEGDRGLVQRFLGETVEERVAEHAPCSVMIARGEVGAIRRILLCDSGVEGSSSLSRFTADLAHILRGEEDVTVLHVMSQMSAGPGVRGKQLRADAEELMEEDAPEGELLKRDMEILKEEEDVEFTGKVRHGLVVDEILEEAEAGDYDLVVIGAHHGTGWRRLLLEDLAHQIVQRVDRPLLIVRLDSSADLTESD